MRKALLSLLLAVAMLFPLSVKGSDRIEANLPPTTAELQQGISNSVLAVYHGEQKCAWVKQQVFIFEINEWKCSFEETFTCTATVIAKMDENNYIAVTAGHCFDWKEEDKYYVSDNTVGKPVLHKVELVKFENDERYDYGIVTFKSVKNYPVVRVEKMDQTAPPIGTTIINANFSYGIVKEFAEGKVVSDIIQGDAGGACPNCKGRYFVTIGVGPGASGSAIIDANTGEIVGLAEAIFPETQMPTLVIPMGKNFADFMEDDSAGLKPLPEGPLPKDEKAPAAPESDVRKTLLKILVFLLIV